MQFEQILRSLGNSKSREFNCNENSNFTLLQFLEKRRSGIAPWLLIVIVVSCIVGVVVIVLVVRYCRLKQHHRYHSGGGDDELGLPYHIELEENDFSIDQYDRE